MLLSSDMDYQLNCFKPDDYPMIKSWWESQKEFPPTPDMIPMESSWIMSKNGVPILMGSIFLMNVKHLAWIENFAGNPEASGEERREGTRQFLLFARNFAKDLGYKTLFCMSHKEKLTSYYQEIGFTKTADVTCFTMEI